MKWHEVTRADLNRQGMSSPTNVIVLARASRYHLQMIRSLGFCPALLATLFWVFAGALLGARAAVITPAADWPQFRGPQRNGDCDETGILKTFPEGGLKIEWRRPVGGG